MNSEHNIQSDFWDQRAHKYESDIAGKDSDLVKLKDSLIPFINGEDQILDLGCASGEIGLALAPSVKHIHGIDTSEMMIRLARDKSTERQVDNIEFRCCDIRSQSLQSASYTKVIALNILHLVDDLEDTLRHLYHLLEPGGLFLSHTPCLRERSWLFQALVGFAQKMGMAPPIRGFSYHELECILARNHFELLDVQLWNKREAVQRIVAKKITGPKASFLEESKAPVINNEKSTLIERS